MCHKKCCRRHKRRKHGDDGWSNQRGMGPVEAVYLLPPPPPAQVPQDIPYSYLGGRGAWCGLVPPTGSVQPAWVNPSLLPPQTPPRTLASSGRSQQASAVGDNQPIAGGDSFYQQQQGDWSTGPMFLPHTTPKESSQLPTMSDPQPHHPTEAKEPPYQPQHQQGVWLTGSIPLAHLQQKRRNQHLEVSNARPMPTGESTNQQQKNRDWSTRPIQLPQTQQQRTIQLATVNTQPETTRETAHLQHQQGFWSTGPILLPQTLPRCRAQHSVIDDIPPPAAARKNTNKQQQQGGANPTGTSPLANSTQRRPPQIVAVEKGQRTLTKVSTHYHSQQEGKREPVRIKSRSIIPNQLTSESTLEPVNVDSSILDEGLCWRKDRDEPRPLPCQPQPFRPSLQTPKRKPGSHTNNHFFDTPSDSSDNVTVVQRAEAAYFIPQQQTIECFRLHPTITENKYYPQKSSSMQAPKTIFSTTKPSPAIIRRNSIHLGVYEEPVRDISVSSDSRDYLKQHPPSTVQTLIQQPIAHLQTNEAQKQLDEMLVMIRKLKECTCPEEVRETHTTHSFQNIKKEKDDDQINALQEQNVPKIMKSPESQENSLRSKQSNLKDDDEYIQRGIKIKKEKSISKSIKSRSSRKDRGSRKSAKSELQRKFPSVRTTRITGDDSNEEEITKKEDLKGNSIRSKSSHRDTEITRSVNSGPGKSMILKDEEYSEEDVIITNGKIPTISLSSESSLRPNEFTKSVVSEKELKIEPSEDVNQFEDDAEHSQGEIIKKSESQNRSIKSKISLKGSNKSIKSELQRSSKNPDVKASQILEKDSKDEIKKGQKSIKSLKSDTALKHVEFKKSNASEGDTTSLQEERQQEIYENAESTRSKSIGSQKDLATKHAESETKVDRFSSSKGSALLDKHKLDSFTQTPPKEQDEGKEKRSKSKITVDKKTPSFKQGSTQTEESATYDCPAPEGFRYCDCPLELSKSEIVSLSLPKNKSKASMTSKSDRSSQSMWIKEKSQSSSKPIQETEEEQAEDEDLKDEIQIPPEDIPKSSVKNDEETHLTSAEDLKISISLKTFSEKGSVTNSQENRTTQTIPRDLKQSSNRVVKTKSVQSTTNEEENEAKESVAEKLKKEEVEQQPIETSPEGQGSVNIIIKDILNEEDLQYKRTIIIPEENERSVLLIKERYTRVDPVPQEEQATQTIESAFENCVLPPNVRSCGCPQFDSETAQSSKVSKVSIPQKSGKSIETILNQEVSKNSREIIQALRDEERETEREPSKVQEAQRLPSKSFLKEEDKLRLAEVTENDETPDTGENNMQSIETTEEKEKSVLKSSVQPQRQGTQTKTLRECCIPAGFRPCNCKRESASGKKKASSKMNSQSGKLTYAKEDENELNTKSTISKESKRSTRKPNVSRQEDEVPYSSNIRNKSSGTLSKKSTKRLNMSTTSHGSKSYRASKSTMSHPDNQSIKKSNLQQKERIEETYYYPYPLEARPFYKIHGIDKKGPFTEEEILHDSRSSSDRDILRSDQCWPQSVVYLDLGEGKGSLVEVLDYGRRPQSSTLSPPPREDSEVKQNIGFTFGNEEGASSLSCDHRMMEDLSFEDSYIPAMIVRCPAENQLLASVPCHPYRRPQGRSGSETECSESVPHQYNIGSQTEFIDESRYTEEDFIIPQGTPIFRTLTPHCRSHQTPEGNYTFSDESDNELEGSAIMEEYSCSRTEAVHDGQALNRELICQYHAPDCHLYSRKIYLCEKRPFSTNNSELRDNERESEMDRLSQKNYMNSMNCGNEEGVSYKFCPVNNKSDSDYLTSISCIDPQTKPNFNNH